MNGKWCGQGGEECQSMKDLSSTTQLELTLHLDIVRPDMGTSSIYHALLSERAEGRSVDRVGGSTTNGGGGEGGGNLHGAGCRCDLLELER